MSSNSQPSQAQRKSIDRLFLRFTALYGQLWRSQFKSDEFLGFMKNEWCHALSEIEDACIDEAVEQCRTGKEFPPTLKQFIDLCKNINKRDLSKDQPKEVIKKSRPEVAEKHLTHIKTMLRMITK